jgi:hypothetical protein
MRELVKLLLVADQAFSRGAQNLTRGDPSWSTAAERKNVLNVRETHKGLESERPDGQKVFGE